MPGAALREDRRAFPRAGVAGQIWVHRPNCRPQRTLRAGGGINLGVPHTLANISFNGAKFQGAAPCGKIGDQLEIALPAIGREKILVVGHIVRVEEGRAGCGVAVEFDHMSQLDQLRLSRVMGVLLSRPPR